MIVNENEILFLGTENCGKTSLIENISIFCQADKFFQNGYDISFGREPFMVCKEPVTVPTQGVDVRDVHITSGTSLVDISVKDVRNALVLREIGSGTALASNWGSYILQTKYIVFVIDCSDPSYFGTSYSLLHELLGLLTYSDDPNAIGKSILVILNKIDLCEAVYLQMLKNILRFDEIKRSFTVGKIELVAGKSFGDNKLLHHILQWHTQDNITRKL